MHKQLENVLDGTEVQHIIYLQLWHMKVSCEKWLKVTTCLSNPNVYNSNPFFLTQLHSARCYSKYEICDNNIIITLIIHFQLKPVFVAWFLGQVFLFHLLRLNYDVCYTLVHRKKLTSPLVFWFVKLESD